LQNVYKNPKALKEANEFSISNVMNSTIEKISRRLGLAPARNLSLAEITLIYTTCAFETAWDSNNGGISPWCAIFDEDDLQVNLILPQIFEFNGKFKFARMFTR
jgi:hypothetical protein